MTQSNMAKWDVSSFKPWDESGSCDMPPDAFYCSVLVCTYVHAIHASIYYSVCICLHAGSVSRALSLACTRTFSLTLLAPALSLTLSLSLSLSVSLEELCVHVRICACVYACCAVLYVSCVVCVWCVCEYSLKTDLSFTQVYSNHTSNDDNIPMSGCGASSGAQTKGFYQGTKNY